MLKNAAHLLPSPSRFPKSHQLESISSCLCFKSSSAMACSIPCSITQLPVDCLIPVSFWRAGVLPLSSCFLHTVLYTYYLLHACLVASVVYDSVTPWTVGCQAPLSMGFSRQEYWSGSPFPSPGDQTQGLNVHLSHLLHWQTGSYRLSH